MGYPADSDLTPQVNAELRISYRVGENTPFWVWGIIEGKDGEERKVQIRLLRSHLGGPAYQEFFLSFEEAEALAPLLIEAMAGVVAERNKWHKDDDE